MTTPPATRPDASADPCLLCGGRDADPVVVTPPHLGRDGGERFRFVRCRTCGLVRQSPRPDPADVARYYGPGYLPHRGPEAWGRWAPLVRLGRRRQDARRVAEARRALESTGAALAESGPAAAGRPGGAVPGPDAPASPRVLDVGCGRPTFLRALADASGARCLGVDTSDAGWRDLPQLQEGLDLRVGTVETADLEPGFDLVTLWHALEHVGEPRPFLERLRELVRPGGALLVEVPDHASLPRRLQGPAWIGYDAPRHAAAYEPVTLRRMLASTGWREVEIRRRGTIDPWVLVWLGRQVRRGRTLEGSLEGDFLPFLAGKVLTWPLAALALWLPLGAMLARARAP